MADLTTYPLQDYYETTLSQAWDGGTGTVYVNATPDFTFPSGVTTYIVVNPGKSNMQVAKINAYDSSAKTLTVSSISVNKGASLAYSQQSHAVGSVVRISNGYQFWADLVAAFNDKVDTNAEINFNYYATVAARDADLVSPTIGKDYAYCLDTDLLYIYTGSGWQAFENGTTTANASETVAGKVEEATDAETTAGTATGGTGAKLVVTPTKLSKVVQSGSYVYAGASSAGTDTYAVTMTPTLTAYTTGMAIIFKADVANTGACTINIDSLGAKSIKTLNGLDPDDGQIAANHFCELIYDGTNMVLQNPVVDRGDFSATAGENLSAGDAVRYGVALPGSTLEVTASSNDTEANEGGLGYEWGQSFTVAASGSGVLSSIDVEFAANTGSPTGNITCKLYSDEGSTLLESSTPVAESGITATTINFAFAGTTELSAGITYYFMLDLDRGADGSNYSNVKTLTTNPYAGGTLYRIEGATWTSVAGTDMTCTINIGADSSETTTKLYKTDASILDKTDVIGFANDDASADATAYVDAVITKNQSGLTPNSVYYLSDTAGEISSSAGTNSQVVGKALNATTLILDKSAT